MEYAMSPVTLAPPPEQPVIKYAGFWRRWLASFLDGLLIWMIIFLIYIFLRLSHLSLTEVLSDKDHDIVHDLIKLLFDCILLSVLWLYHAIMESSDYQGTLGKMAMGIRVTDLDGKRIDFGRATGRYFSKILSFLTLMIGYIMAAFTKKKQALHDIIAGTLVLMRDDK
jgi:uncharacterized RDD family membrane protein YckC